MRNTPPWDSLHRGDETALGTPPLADYPIPLLTRRTFGEMAGGILASRPDAPCGVSLRSATTRPRNV